jgi:hypothetical protein
MNGGASQLTSHSPGPAFNVIGFVGHAGTIVGGIASIIVTEEMQLPKLSHSSYTFKVTLFTPTLAQEKVEGEIEYLKFAVAVQLSVDPLSIIAGVIVTLPEASILTVIFLHLATGMTLSFTVIVWVHVEEFPHRSVPL